MTTYCNIGDKPRIEISFGVGGSPTLYYPGFSPVEILVEEYTEKTPNYLPGGYQLFCYSTNNGRGFALRIRDYEIRDNGADFPFNYRYVLWVQLCNTSALIQYFNVDPNSITIDTSITCELIENIEHAVKIHIRKPGENIDIYSVIGEIPYKIEVACGDCPEGKCRCPSPGYPGYCCLDCSVISTQLHTITNELRSKNGYL